MTHHHLLMLLLLLLDHQQLVIVLLLLLLLIQGVVALWAVVGRIYHPMIGSREVQRLLIPSRRIVHAHGVLLLILLAHLLHALHRRLVMLLVAVVLMTMVILLLLSLLLLRVDGRNIKFLVAEARRVKCLKKRQIGEIDANKFDSKRIVVKFWWKP